MCYLKYIISKHRKNPTVQLIRLRIESKVCNESQADTD